MNRALTVIIVGAVSTVLLTLAAYVLLVRFRPEDEIRRMLAAMSRLETVSEKAGFSWTDDDGARVTTTVYTNGQMHLVDGVTLEHGTQFRVVRVSEDSAYEDLSGEVRMIDDTTYLTYAPPGPEVTGLEFEEEGVWVSFEEGQLPEWGAIIPGLNAPLTSDPRASSWTPETRTLLRDLLVRADVLWVSYDKVTEEIDGVETRVIDAQFDPDALRAFLRDMVRAREGREPTNEERIHVEKQAAALERLTMRLWIGSDDHLLYRLQAAGAIPAEEGNELRPADVLIEFSDFNSVFRVTAPSQAIAFEELLRRTFANLPSASISSLISDDEPLVSRSARLPTSTVEDNEDPDGDGLDKILEGFYGTNPSKADTDGDGMSDGEEVRNGQNPRGSGSLFGFGLGE